MVVDSWWGWDCVEAFCFPLNEEDDDVVVVFVTISSWLGKISPYDRWNSSSDSAGSANPPCWCSCCCAGERNDCAGAGSRDEAADAEDGPGDSWYCWAAAKADGREEEDEGPGLLPPLARSCAVSADGPEP